MPKGPGEGASLRSKRGAGAQEAPVGGRRCPAPRWRCGAWGAPADTGWYCTRNWRRRDGRDGVRRRPHRAGT